LSYPNRNASIKKELSMTRWKHHMEVATLNEANVLLMDQRPYEERLRELGAEGWELVTVVPARTTGSAMFQVTVSMLLWFRMAEP